MSDREMDEYTEELDESLIKTFMYASTMFTQHRLAEEDYGFYEDILLLFLQFIKADRKKRKAYVTENPEGYRLMHIINHHCTWIVNHMEWVKRVHEKRGIIGLDIELEEVKKILDDKYKEMISGYES